LNCASEQACPRIVRHARGDRAMALAIRFGAAFPRVVCRTASSEGQAARQRHAVKCSAGEVILG